MQLFLIGGGTAHWNGTNTNIWSDSSGGSAGTIVPGPNDDVIIDDNSGTPTVIVGENLVDFLAIKSIAFSGYCYFYTNNYKISLSGTNDDGKTIDLDPFTGKMFLGFSNIEITGDNSLVRMSGQFGEYHMEQSTFTFLGGDSQISVHPNTVDFKIGFVDVQAGGFSLLVDSGT